ncbi:MAG TPA: transcriptional coactivator p15/PC4 family protein [Novosphingobium sp.]|jgi:hypothetical protein|nr:transcriptional coactivator p15/PC4 family protein [Novosphingobium sp.]
MTVVASVPKRPGEEIRISVEEFQGKTRVNVRVWWEDDFGEWKPGKQGISMTAEQFRAVWGNCQAVDAVLKEKGQ